MSDMNESQQKKWDAFVKNVERSDLSEAIQNLMDAVEEHRFNSLDASELYADALDMAIEDIKEDNDSSIHIENGKVLFNLYETITDDCSTVGYFDISGAIDFFISMREHGENGKLNKQDVEDAKKIIDILQSGIERLSSVINRGIEPENEEQP